MPSSDLYSETLSLFKKNYKEFQYDFYLRTMGRTGPTAAIGAAIITRAGSRTTDTALLLSGRGWFRTSAVAAPWIDGVGPAAGVKERVDGMAACKTTHSGGRFIDPLSDTWVTEVVPTGRLRPVGHLASDLLCGCPYSGLPVMTVLSRATWTTSILSGNYLLHYWQTFLCQHSLCTPDLEYKEHGDLDAQYQCRQI